LLRPASRTARGRARGRRELLLAGRAGCGTIRRHGTPALPRPVSAPPRGRARSPARKRRTRSRPAERRAASPSVYTSGPAGRSDSPRSPPAPPAATPLRRRASAPSRDRAPRGSSGSPVPAPGPGGLAAPRPAPPGTRRRRPCASPTGRRAVPGRPARAPSRRRAPTPRPARERALELTRAFDILPESETQIPEGAQRFHFGTAVLERFRHAERQLIPRPRLRQPAHLFLEPAPPDERAHDTRGVAALPGFQCLHVRLAQHVHVLGDEMQRLRQTAPQLVGVDAALAQREVRAGARPQGPPVRARNGDQQRAQRRQRLDPGPEPQRFFAAP